MLSRIVISLTLSTLLLVFVITAAPQIADGHGGAGGPGHMRMKDKICTDVPCTENKIEKGEKNFCFLFWCF